MEKAKIFCNGIRTEFRKIVWPSKEQLLKNLVFVVVVASIIGIFCVVIDYGFQFAFDALAQIGGAV